MPPQKFHLIVGEAALVLGDSAVALKGKDPVHRTIQEVAVMGHCHHDTGKAVQIILKDRHGADVEVVRRLIQYQHIGRTHQHPEKIEPPLLTAGQLLHLHKLLGGRKQEAVQHDAGTDQTIRGMDILRDGAHRIDHPLAAVQRLIFLTEIGDSDGLADMDLATVRLLPAGNQLHQC